MGFFKSFLKTFKNTVDRFLPERVKDISLDDFIPERLKKSNRKSQDLPPVAPVPEDVTGRVNEAEAAEIARKRLSRVGRFFTGVLGVTSKATTASQKVFS